MCWTKYCGYNFSSCFMKQSPQCQLSLLCSSRSCSLLLANSPLTPLREVQFSSPYIAKYRPFLFYLSPWFKAPLLKVQKKKSVPGGSPSALMDSQGIIPQYNPWCLSASLTQVMKKWKLLSFSNPPNSYHSFPCSSPLTSYLLNFSRLTLAAFDN